MFKPLKQNIQMSYFSPKSSVKIYNCMGSRLVESLFELLMFKFNDSNSRISETFISCLHLHYVYESFVFSLSIDNLLTQENFTQYGSLRAES